MKSVFLVVVGESHKQSWIESAAETKELATKEAEKYMERSGKIWLPMHPNGTVWLAGVNYVRIENYDVVKEANEQSAVSTT